MMTIKQHTSSHLLLEKRPNVHFFLPSMLIGLPALTIFAFGASIGSTTLTCKRVEPTLVNCEKQQSAYFGLIQRQPATFNAVTKTEFRTTKLVDSEGNTTVDNWVAIKSRAGEQVLFREGYRFGGVSGDVQELKQMVAQINQFLESEQSSLVIQRSILKHFVLMLMMIVILVPMMILGVKIIYSGLQYEILQFDKVSQRFVRDTWTLLGRRRQMFALEEIAGVEIDEETDGEGDRTYQLKLLSESIHAKTLLFSTNLEEVQALQKSIRDFLQVR